MNPDNKERCRHNISKELTSNMETGGTKQSSINVIYVAVHHVHNPISE